MSTFPYQEAQTIFYAEAMKHKPEAAQYAVAYSLILVARAVFALVEALPAAIDRAAANLAEALDQ